MENCYNQDVLRVFEAKNSNFLLDYFGVSLRHLSKNAWVYIN